MSYALGIDVGGTFTDAVHGLRASAYKSAYVSAKHGLQGLSKVIALEGASHGVTSNCVPWLRAYFAGREPIGGPGRSAWDEC
jgi:hypothetical protein